MTPTSESLVHSNKPTTADRLRKSFADREYADAYARSALNAYIATQIKVIREQRGWTQGKLADEAGMKQPRIAVMEDVDYSSWSITTLWRLAQAFHLRLKVSFEEFGTLPYEIETFDRKSLERLPLERDPFITGNLQNQLSQGLINYFMAGGEGHFPWLQNNIVWLGRIQDIPVDFNQYKSWVGQDYGIGALNAALNAEVLGNEGNLPSSGSPIDTSDITCELI